VLVVEPPVQTDWLAEVAKMFLRLRNLFHAYLNKSSAVAEMGDRLATIDMGQKVGGAMPLLGVVGSPSNTMLSGPRPTSVPVGILIHPAVRLQQIWAENWGVCPLFWGWSSVPI